ARDAAGHFERPRNAHSSADDVRKQLRAVQEATMTETPHSFAETPEHRWPPAPDLLSAMLKAVRLTGAVFLNARFTAPFGVIDPKSYGERTPMAHLRHISILHLIVAGGCDFETAGERRTVTRGDLIFLPLPGQYRFWSGEPERMAEANEIVRP